MENLKITTFNVEWMTHLFKTQKAEFWQGASLNKGMGSKPKNVQMVCNRLASVIKEINPDVLGIQEGPPLKSQMELFVHDFLDNAYDVFTIQDGAQSVHALVRKGITKVTIEQIPETHKIYEHLARKIEYYKWGELNIINSESFTRKPVVLSLKHQNGECIELMIVHTKSKISKLKNPKQWELRDHEAIIDAVRSRQKLSAEIAAIRRYLTHAILSKRVNGCIVMGDMNDGINRDIFESQFLVTSIVNELRGNFNRENATMHHAFSQKYLASKKAYSSDFNDPTVKGKKIRELLDHILFTSVYFLEPLSGFKIESDKNYVEHEIFEKHLSNEGKTRDDRPSDHIPVSVFLNI